MGETRRGVWDEGGAWKLRGKAWKIKVWRGGAWECVGRRGMLTHTGHGVGEVWNSCGEAWKNTNLAGSGGARRGREGRVGEWRGGAGRGVARKGWP